MPGYYSPITALCSKQAPQTPPNTPDLIGFSSASVFRVFLALHNQFDSVRLALHVPLGTSFPPLCLCVADSQVPSVQTRASHSAEPSLNLDPQTATHRPNRASSTSTVS